MRARHFPIRFACLLAAAGASSVIIAAPADSTHVRGVLLAKLSAYEAKSDNLYHVTNGTFVVGTHEVNVTPVVETDTNFRGKSVFAMRLELAVDGNAQPGATFGAIGIAAEKEEAIAVGLGEWYMGFGLPYFQALANKAATDSFGEYDVYPGAMGLRGGSPAGWMNDNAAMHQKLLAVAVPLLSGDRDMVVLDLKVAVPPKGPANSECRVDAQVSGQLSRALSALDWPAGSDVYIFKQVYVLKKHRARPIESR